MTEEVKKTEEVNPEVTTPEEKGATKPTEPVKSGEGKTFNQTQVDSIALNAKEQAARTTETRILELAGVKTLDELTKYVKEGLSSEQARLTDAEKTQQQINALALERDKFKKDFEDLQNTRKTEIRDQRIIGILGDEVIDPETAKDLILKTSTYLKEDGSVDEDAIKAAVTKLKTEKGYLFRDKKDDYKGIRTSRDGTPPAPDKQRADAALQRMQERVQRKG